jgi:hypothetical protein
MILCPPRLVGSPILVAEEPVPEPECSIPYREWVAGGFADDKTLDLKQWLKYMEDEHSSAEHNNEAEVPPRREWDSAMCPTHGAQDLKDDEPSVLHTVLEKLAGNLGRPFALTVAEVAEEHEKIQLSIPEIVGLRRAPAQQRKLHRVGPNRGPKPR